MSTVNHPSDDKAPSHETSIDVKDGHDSDSNAAQNTVATSVNNPETKEAGGRWFHWHEPGTSKQEKRLIFKLDWFLLSYSCLCFFNKYLDQTNISNAYVSGMSEELGFGKANEVCSDIRDPA